MTALVICGSQKLPRARQARCPVKDHQVVHGLRWFWHREPTPGLAVGSHSDAPPPLRARAWAPRARICHSPRFPGQKRCGARGGGNIQITFPGHSHSATVGGVSHGRGSDVRSRCLRRDALGCSRRAPRMVGRQGEHRGSHPARVEPGGGGAAAIGTSMQIEGG